MTERSQSYCEETRGEHRWIEEKFRDDDGYVVHVAYICGDCREPGYAVPKNSLPEAHSENMGHLG